MSRPLHQNLGAKLPIPLVKMNGDSEHWGCSYLATCQSSHVTDGELRTGNATRSTELHTPGFLPDTLALSQLHQLPGQSWRALLQTLLLTGATLSSTNF